MTQVIECLPNKDEVLSLIPIATPPKKKKNPVQDIKHHINYKCNQNIAGFYTEYL
jgi:hypothetical protein